MHFQISLSLWELQIIRDWLCVRDIAETSLNRLLLFLILKSSHQSYSVEKDVLRNFTGKNFRLNVSLIKLPPLRPATQVLSTEICKIFNNTYFWKQLYLRVNLYLPCKKKKGLTKRNWENFEKTVKFLSLNYFLKKVLS